MKEKKLTQGQVALVDDDNFGWLNSFKWFAHKDDFKYNNGYYAVKKINKGGKSYMQCMHRLILNINDSKLLVDHINGNKLDNRKENLRIATKSENGRNRDRQSNNKSGFKGVHWNKQFGKYRAQIMLNNKTTYIGLYTNPVEAAKAYDLKAKELHGEFARLNFN
jgi:hypothetical protein